MLSLEKQIKSSYQSTQKSAGHRKKSRDTRISKQVKLNLLLKPITSYEKPQKD